MTDLAAALREAGHGDVADALERKELAGRLRQSGRDDLADALEGGDQPAEALEAGEQPADKRQERPAPASPAEQEQRFAEQYRDALNAAITPSFDVSA
jgi:hypothetical protein